MKFSELNREQWAELQPYLDTAVLPVTGLTGGEMPFQATEALERLRDVLDLIEIPFKGRIVTYPAYQYGSIQTIETICANLKRTGFRYVIVVAAFGIEGEEGAAPSADLLIGTDAEGQRPSAQAVKEAVGKLWLGV